MSCVRDALILWRLLRDPRENEHQTVYGRLPLLHRFKKQPETDGWMLGFRKELRLIFQADQLAAAAAHVKRSISEGKTVVAKNDLQRRFSEPQTRRYLLSVCAQGLRARQNPRAPR